MATKKRNNARDFAIVINNESLLLMYHKKPTQAYYAFPGGTVEPQEKPEEAVLRELYEEASVKTQLVRLLHHIQIIDNSIYIFLLYVINRKIVVIGPKSNDKKNHKIVLRPCNCAMAELSNANVPHPIK